MKIVCHSYSSDHALKYAAAMLHTEQMFEQSGQLQDSFLRIAETGKDRRADVMILVAWAGPNVDRPVGCLLYEPKRSRAQFYVSPTKRRKGIAGLMLKRLREMENYGNRVIEAVQGYPGSMEFFEKNFIYIPETSFSAREVEDASKEIRIKTGELLISSWRAFRILQQRRKRAFRSEMLKAKKAGKI